MKNYSSDFVEIAWEGLDFKEGLAAGSFVTEARTAPSWSGKTSVAGELIRTFNPDRSATVSILVNQTSKLHQQLRQLAENDRLNRNVVGAMVLKDTSSGEQFTYVNAFITVDPDEIRATESQDFTWVFMCERITKTVSEDQNLVGS